MEQAREGAPTNEQIIGVTSPAAVQRLRLLAGRSHRARKLRPLYRFSILRPVIARAAKSLEGGEMFSQTLRDILREVHGVQVGLYSYGPCLTPGALPRGTCIGRYCSLGADIKVFRRNHPKERISSHPLFYNRSCGLVKLETLNCVEDNPLIVGHDVWIGANSLILSKCRSIGDGAIIGAGSIVTRDVLAFSIVAGNPAKIVGQRFDANTQRLLSATAWWNHPIDKLAEHLDCFVTPACIQQIAVLARALNGLESL